MQELIIPIVILLWTIQWFMIGVLCESFYRDLFGKVYLIKNMGRR